MRVHYPRTPHLPWSPGVSADDVRVTDLSAWAGREVVVTEKLDGENTTLYADGLHARSLDSAHHPSRAWVKALHGRIAAGIPAGWRVCGENMYARHSIPYDDLDSWFYAFSVWAGDHCLDWDSTARFARRLGVPVPPVLWRGVFDERVIRGIRLDTGRQEGYVVRPVAGFDRDEFGTVVGKWVRSGHVQTDTHWMLAPVVPNGRGRQAVWWDIRSGLPVDSALVYSTVDVEEPPDGAQVIADVDVSGRTGDARLAAVLATVLSGQSRTAVLPGLVELFGMALGRRIADLVGLHPLLWRPYPAEHRRAGLVRLAFAADLAVLHAVAAVRSPDAAAAEEVDWSLLYAEEAGLLAEQPLRELRDGFKTAVAGLGAEAAERCWAEAREAYADGRVTGVDDAAAYTWRWRSGEYPRLILTAGPAGSGKSRFVAGLSHVDEVISLDDLRAARGSRADQRANPELLRDGLARLEAALSGERTVVWDATCLNRHQRSLVASVAARRNASVTQAVFVVSPERLAKRNAEREHAVPAEVLAGQLDRFQPPYPGEAHRLWYVGESGTVEDRAGGIDDEDP